MIYDLSLKTDDLNYINKVINNMEMKEQFFPLDFHLKKVIYLLNMD
jgi:hypothetical protein